MKNKFTLFFLVALQTLCFASTTSERLANKLPKIEEYLDKVTSAYHIPGMAFVLTDSEETFFSKTCGQCENIDQVFIIGSGSKSYTALGIMQLVEKGLINLDDDISTYLSDYKFPQKISVRSLLNHTTGFDEHMKLSNAKITESYGHYEYSNVNYDLLGKIIESVSKMSYEDYMRENVFAPLGMDSAVANASKLKNNKKLLKGNRNFFGLFVKGNPDYPKKNSWFHEPAGFLATSPSDHAKYLRMYLNNGVSDSGKQILKKESINSMWYETVEISPRETSRYGMGWNYDRFGNTTYIYHAGQVENYISFTFLLPGKNLAAAFMINGNDQFGMNALMGNTIPGVISILEGSSPKELSHSEYSKIHLILNLICLAIILISLLFFIISIRKKSKFRVLSIILLILGNICWPAFILLLSKIAFATPLWVIKSYVPDLFYTILFGAALSIGGGLIKLKRIVFRQ